MFCGVCDVCGTMVQYPDFPNAYHIICHKCGNVVVDYFDITSRKSVEFLNRNPWLKEMWQEYEVASGVYWSMVQKINEKYTKVAQEHGLDSAELWSDDEGNISGIDINSGYGDGGYDFSKNKMLIHSGDLYNLVEEEKK